MKLLVVGSGGREHALAWRLAQSPRVQMVYVAPGNAGTATTRGLKNLPITDFEALAEWAHVEGIAYTVVGPDAALAAGIVNVFEARGLKILGPTREAAELEWSKDFAKAFMARHQIPTARYQTFDTAAAAHAYVNAQGAPIVIKADGLAAGKGVVVAMTLDEAHAAIDMMMVDAKFGASGAKVVIEEFMQGEEASFFVMSDGKHILPLASAQDHKRLLDGDAGPNTGGMGAYSPAPVVTPDVHRQIMNKVVKPTIEGMAAEGRPFKGFLFVGLMIDEAGEARVVEFNARMGDPETQVIMARVKSDFAQLCEMAVDGELDRAEIDWDRRTALTVVLAAHGYPDSPRNGDPIFGIPEPTDASIVFHAGTRLSDDGHLVTAGGRVLACVGLGDSPRMAQAAAYDVVDEIKFRDMQYRRDIGYRAIGRNRSR
ncbi:MAG TPA: phosphoribosylamine--glycine ligase [Burkholderiaceae bacterium]|nr:phosphoribosylamine--glycine ligase [Burkholderiaceae bacterium]